VGISEELRSLNFHDSLVREIQVAFSDPEGRSLVLDLDYYDWAGNKSRRQADPNASWTWRRLRMRVGYLAHLEISAPELLHPAHEIDSAEVGFGLARFEEQYRAFQRQHPRAKYPLFEDGETVSIRFLTHNWSDDSQGFVWIVGNHASLEWIDDGARVGQTHVPTKDV
jgi:hypothetical protein